MIFVRNYEIIRKLKGGSLRVACSWVADTLYILDMYYYICIQKKKNLYIINIKYISFCVIFWTPPFLKTYLRPWLDASNDCYIDFQFFFTPFWKYLPYCYKNPVARFHFNDNFFFLTLRLWLHCIGSMT